MAENLRMGTVEWLLLVTLSILWGGAFFFVSIGDALITSFRALNHLIEGGIPAHECRTTMSTTATPGYA